MNLSNVSMSSLRKPLSLLSQEEIYLRISFTVTFPVIVSRIRVDSDESSSGAFPSSVSRLTLVSVAEVDHPDLPRNPR